MSIEFALIGTGLGLGLRHGIDWDHIAAITDITGTEPDRRKAVLLGSLYASGHALVVIVLGLIALLLGSTLPEGLDAAMEVVVGITLIALGLWLLYTIWRHGAEYRLRSRWMLLFAGVGRLVTWMRSRLPYEHRHHHIAADHEHDHRHEGYGVRAALSVGMLHGVGAETGSQVLLFAAAAGATSNASGTALLIAFVVGLMLSNSAITLGSVMGLWGSRSNRIAYIGIGLFAAVFSLVVGTLFLLSRSAILPPLLS